MNIGILLAAFVGAGIEFVETAAIAYALARAGFRREAISGTAAGLFMVAIASLLVGSSLRFIPLRPLQIAIGLLLLWFGGGWVRKAIKRQAAHQRPGWVSDPLGKIGANSALQAKFSKLNFIVMTKSAALEGLEAAIVVVTLGLASTAWVEAVIGAGVALLATVGIVAILHGHLKQIPEVLIKLGAGILLVSFGIFWLGEGAGVNWPGGDLVLLVIVPLTAMFSGIAIKVLRNKEA